jgi:uncharacterized protein (DUF427 family)
MVKAVWNGQVLAQSNNTVIVDRKHYFPIEDVNRDFLEESDTHTVCSWKGEASYYTVNVAGKKKCRCRMVLPFA